jgi:hypothetical protein
VTCATLQRDGQLFCFHNTKVRKYVMVSPSIQGDLARRAGCVSCITSQRAISVALCAKC